MENEKKLDYKIEEQQYDFLSKDITRPTTFIRRFQQGNNRFYYTVDPAGKVKLYSSGTTLIKDGYAEDKIALETWRNKLRAEGKDPGKELEYAASRGTLMHFLLGYYIQGKPINLSDLDILINEEAPELTMLPYFGEIMAKDIEWLQKAILAFGQFVEDYNVKPVALELIMKSEKYQVASPIDMICKMTIKEEGYFGEVYKTGEKKGQPKLSKQEREVYTIVDFKSTQSGFYDSHYLQLQLYKRIVAENYPDLKIEGLFNWSPKEWITSPSYNLKDQSGTDSLLGNLCEVIYEQGKIKHTWKTPTIKLVEGSVSIDNFKTDVIKRVSLVEFLEQLHKK